MIMALLGMFIVASLSQATTEATLMNNENTNSEAFYAAQASLELMSRNFNNLFDFTLSPTTSDLNSIQSSTPSIPGFTMAQTVTQISTSSTTVTIGTGQFAGLNALRNAWSFTATATNTNGSQVQLTRTVNNYLVPIFQFGTFYNNDMDFHPGPLFNFGGRVHSNGNIYLAAGSGLYFASKVTAAGAVVTDKLHNGKDLSTIGATLGNVYVSNGSSNVSVTQGSVVGGPNTNGSQPLEPTGTVNSGWTAFDAAFRGNLVANAAQLKLPLTIGNNDPVELVRRGLSTDSSILASSRYFNKAGIRVCISDTQAQLPGATGGINLTATQTDGKKGYWPVQRTGVATRATRINAARFAPAPGGAIPQIWIKVENVSVNDVTGVMTTSEITSDFLSLGMTQATTIGSTTVGDTDAILKLQRYTIAGPPVRVADLTSTNTASAAVPSVVSGSNVFSYNSNGSSSFSYVKTSNYTESNETTHDAVKTVTIGTSVNILPFPIEMFEPREGIYNEDLADSDYSTLYGVQSVPVVGVMSVIDIDIANLKNFFNANYDGQFPGGLTSTAIGNNGGQGFILYVSDRRGDYDNDGEYDNENVYVSSPTDDTVQTGEDVNLDGTVQMDYVHESARYSAKVATDIGAIWDHSYFRRAVRVINGSSLPGNTNQGLTVATENPIYVQGNYNSTGVSTGPSSSGPSPYTAYTGSNVPASIVGDAIGILSKEWNDGKSFRFPFDQGSSSDTFNSRYVDSSGETTVRAAFLCGHSMSVLWHTPNQGGGDQCLAGGVHNFPRLLENWNGNRLNYCGSLIDLFYSRQANGTHKNGSHVYAPPQRNWVFDATFLNATQVPPGTPYFQYVNMTGFRQSLR
jgi:hypothetical protein